MRRYVAQFREMADGSQASLSQTFKFNFGCKLEKLSPALQSRFVLNSVDEEMAEFLEACDYTCLSTLKHWVDSVGKAFLSTFLSRTTVNGMLHRGSMFVLSSQQFKQHLLCSYTPEQPPYSKPVLLDIGAGDGNVTARLASMFSHVFATETCRVMRWRLQMHGYTCLGLDDWQATGELEGHWGSDETRVRSLRQQRRYDVISCLNVLDRCEYPVTLLEQMRDSLIPVTGRIIVALVLPYKPFVELGNGKYSTPVQYLPVSGATWEDNVNSLAIHLFEPLGLVVEVISRTPYLCQGDIHKPYYVLSDTIFVLSQSPSFQAPTGAASSPGVSVI